MEENFLNRVNLDPVYEISIEQGDNAIVVTLTDGEEVIQQNFVNGNSSVSINLDKELMTVKDVNFVKEDTDELEEVLTDKFTCDVCGESFETTRGLSVHKGHVHN